MKLKIFNLETELSRLEDYICSVVKVQWNIKSYVVFGVCLFLEVM